VAGGSSEARAQEVCCIGPLGLSDFGSVGVWCFPQLMGGGWLDAAEEGPGTEQEGRG